MAIKVGDRVMTLQFGPGRVERLEDGEAVIRLDGYGRMQIRESVSTLQLLESVDPPVGASTAATGGGAQKPPVARSVPALSLPAPDERFQALEALRFGLVPMTRLQDLTVGYRSLRSWVEDQLPHNHGKGPTVAEITGPYGTGKSHTSAVVRQVAREHNYLTASVEVDGLSVSLSDPEKLLYALWSTLGGPDLESDTPLLDVYLRANSKTSLKPMVATAGIDRVRDNYMVVRLLQSRDLIDSFGEVMDKILSSSDDVTANEAITEICSDPSVARWEVPVKRMIGRRVDERPFDFVESIAGTASVATMAGYAGLVITVDEFEVEYGLTPQKYQRVGHLLSVLADYLARRTPHKPKPVAVFFATAGRDAEAHDVVVDALMERTGGGRQVLEPLGEADRADLGGKILDLYADAYGLSNVDSSVTQTAEARLREIGAGSESGLTRAFIKQVMASLDLTYGPPNAS